MARSSNRNSQSKPKASGGGQRKQTVAKKGADRGRAKSAPPSGTGRNNKSTRSKSPGPNRGGRGGGRGGRRDSRGGRRDGRGGRGSGRGGGRGGRQNKEHEKKKPATKEELDNAMDDYWMKSDNKEMKEKKLDEDMDSYWEKKGQGTAESSGDAAATDEGKAEENVGEEDMEDVEEGKSTEAATSEP